LDVAIKGLILAMVSLRGLREAYDAALGVLKGNSNAGGKGGGGGGGNGNGGDDSDQDCSPQEQALLKETKDERKLRRRLNLAVAQGLTFVPTPRNAAHHIVPGNETGDEIAGAQRVLRRFCIGINEWQNGVFLPDYRAKPDYTGADGIPYTGPAIFHSSTQCKAYFSAVSNSMVSSSSKDGAYLNLDKIRRALLDGTYTSCP
jgi:hypothetical protein